VAAAVAAQLVVVVALAGLFMNHKFNCLLEVIL
jgi:hypothetical protein